MEVKLSLAMAPVRHALTETNHKALVRRLQVYGQKVPCKSGCSGCCSRLNVITVAEALMMYEHLLKTKEWSEVAKKAREQFQDVKDANPLSWFKQNRKCPVLDQTTNKCTAYSVRPSTCATHFVTSNPSMCDPWNTKPGKYEPIDFTDLHVQFRMKLMEHTSAYGIMELELPIPTALLLAERISIQSGMEPNDVLALMYQELSRGQ